MSSVIGTTQALLRQGLERAITLDQVTGSLQNAVHCEAWLRDVAQALIEAERGDPPQTRGLRKDIAVEVSQDRILNPPRPARTNLGRRESDR